MAVLSDSLLVKKISFTIPKVILPMIIVTYYSNITIVALSKKLTKNIVAITRTCGG